MLYGDDNVAPHWQSREGCGSGVGFGLHRVTQWGMRSHDGSWSEKDQAGAGIAERGLSRPRAAGIQNASTQEPVDTL